jgi:hypothetical protein
MASRYLIASVFLLLVTSVAQAQIPCTQALQGSVACFSVSTNLRSTDLLSGMQGIGPLRSPQSVGIPVSQILNGIPIGNTTPSTGVFTTLTSSGATSFLERMEQSRSQGLERLLRSQTPGLSGHLLP